MKITKKIVKIAHSVGILETRFMNLFKKIWNWYCNRFLNQNYDTNVSLDKLRWMPKQLKPGKKEPFGFIDSIYFDIKKIPIKEEIIFEMETKQDVKEVIKCVART